MSWFADTKEAKKQLEICKKNNCSDCNKCIYITESSWAKNKYSKIITQKAIEHPLYKMLIEKFGV
tara:strand:+ start:372 stop:566 length:195 start_codon:yes stop_codon:yes gene_type:complete